MTIRKINAIEWCIALLMSLWLVVGCVGVWEIYGCSENSTFNPFCAYYNNLGIKIIYAASAAAKISCVLLYVILFKDILRSKYLAKSAISFTIIASGFLQWFELYYGSTFYYGEVRDKQGITFPYMTSILTTIMLINWNFTKIRILNIAIKASLVIISNIFFYKFWESVVEKWQLIQS
jgi:hypothetical protein